MASEAVKKILEAEALSDKKNAEARRKRDEMISTASGRSSLAIQKKISEAATEAEKTKRGYDERLSAYKENAEKECSKKISVIRQLAEKNTDMAVDEIISRFF